MPPYNERNHLRLITMEILRHIYGDPDSRVSIAYIDERGETHTKTIQRARREGGYPLLDGWPPFFLEVESKLLDNGIGYICLILQPHL